jgi:hypothetical protein
MLNRWSALMLVVGVAVGYAVAAPPAGAQSPGLPIAPGDRVTFKFESDAASEAIRTVACTVGVIQGDWVRCDSTDPFRPAQSENWYSVRSLLQIRKNAAR